MTLLLSLDTNGGYSSSSTDLEVDPGGMIDVVHSAGAS